MNTSYKFHFRWPTDKCPRCLRNMSTDPLLDLPHVPWHPGTGHEPGAGTEPHTAEARGAAASGAVQRASRTQGQRRGLGGSHRSPSGEGMSCRRSRSDLLAVTGSRFAGRPSNRAAEVGATLCRGPWPCLSASLPHRSIHRSPPGRQGFLPRCAMEGQGVAAHDHHSTEP
jgi:hypothetical protein